MHEAEVLCDRLVILNHGQIVAEGSPQQMIQQHTPGYVGIFESKHRDTIKNLINNRADIHFHEDASGIYLRTPTLVELTKLHSDQGMIPLQIRPANLEDVFLKLTGQELSNEA